MGGWHHVENMTLLKKERLVFHGDREGAPLQQERVGKFSAGV